MYNNIKFSLIALSFENNKIRKYSNGYNDLRHHTMIVGGNALIYLQSISPVIGNGH